MTKPQDTHDVQAAASLYCSLGWYPVPLKPGTKECRDHDWLDRIYEPSEFDPGDNIGLRLVGARDARQKKLVSVDLDCDEAVALSMKFLPESGALWGRASKPISQVLYLAEFEKAVTYKDTATGEVLLEIRVDHQSMAPPSLHPCGERLVWVSSGSAFSAPDVDPDTLKRHARLLATTSLVARYYNPPHNRHDWCLALSGTLRQFNLTEDEAAKIIGAAATHVGDGSHRDRMTEVHSTYSRSEDDPMTGGPRLSELIGEHGRAFVESLRKIWGDRSPFLLDDRGKKIVANDQNNIRRALEEMGVTLSVDMFSKKMIIKRGEGPAHVFDDGASDRLWLDIDSKFRFRPTREFFDTVVRDTARRSPFHPVMDYFSSIQWDGTPRLNEWLITYGKAKNTQYVKAVGPIVLIAAVRRITHPACKFDELLVFESHQGLNKSTALRHLCPNEDWFSDDLPLGVDTKQVIERTAGKWIIEAAELTNMRRAQVEQLKAFLSRQVDGPVRLAYAREPVELPRQFVIVGTTNSVSYLRDSTGNRRFWPVQVGLFDVARIRDDRDQLWAEAVHREARGESIRLDQSLYPDAEGEQEKRRTEDPWEAPLSVFVQNINGEKQRVDPNDIWNVLSVPVERRDERGAERISAIMQRHGFRRMTIRSRDKLTIKGWGRDMVNGIWRPGGWE